MRKHGFLWMFFLVVTLPLQAQITITNVVFPAIGDTLHYAIDDQPDQVIMTAPGGDQIWDFSSLQADRTQERILKDTQTAAGSASFPTATMYYDAGNNAETFLNVSNQEVIILGFAGPDPLILGLDLVARYSPPVVQSRAPVNFFDIKQISSGLLVYFTPGILPGVNQLPITPPDSMRIRIAINRLDVVDAYGTLSIPGGTFEVLRQKSTEYRESRLDAKIPPLGWLDITDVALQYLPVNLGVDTTTTFHFLNNQSKEAIAVVTTDAGGLRGISVQYKNLGQVTGLQAREWPGSELAAFPNPAEDQLRIQANNLKPGDHTLVIYSMNGVEVARHTFQVWGTRLDEVLDISRIGRGIYVCRAYQGGAELHETGRVVFVKQ